MSLFIDFICTVVIIGLTYIIYVNAMRHRISRIKESIEEAVREYNQLRDPRRRVTNKEIEEYAVRTRDLYNKVLGLNKFPFINQINRKFPLWGRFVLIYKSLDEVSAWNAELLPVIKNINDNVVEAESIFASLCDEDHFFTGSEMDYFKEDFQSLYNDILVCDNKRATDYLSDDILQKCTDFKQHFANIETIRKEHNEAFTQSQLAQHKEYFDTMLAYPFDEQQREAIVNLEDNTQVISAAGGGKTTTIVGKIKYLIEKRGYDPSRILLITYTRKAAQELNSRLPFSGLRCVTFHSLAMSIIANATSHRPSICEPYLVENIFASLIRQPEYLKSVNRYFLDHLSLMKDEHEYTADEREKYYRDRKKYGIKPLFGDMNGNTIYTKSDQECMICNFLHCIGVKFRYEQPYEKDLSDSKHRQYRPDFSIYFSDAQNRPCRIYLEHFAIDANGNVPPFFIDNKYHSWQIANNEYNEGIKWKRQIHSENHTTLIETTSAMFMNKTWKQRLVEQLRWVGVPIAPLSEQQIYQDIITTRKPAERNLITLIEGFINLMKSNMYSLDDIRRIAVEKNDSRTLFLLDNIIGPVYRKYCETLRQQGEIDFTDAILRAAQLCKDIPELCEWDYILVDEFQDISKDRYNLLNALRQKDPMTKIFCVGDDWQSIFRFSGSDIALFYDFPKYFGHTAECKIETTYRFGNPMIQKSSDFILHNPNQKYKIVRTTNAAKETDLEFKPYVSEKHQLSIVWKIIESIPENESVYIIGRYSYLPHRLVDVSQGEVKYAKGSTENSEDPELIIASRHCMFMTVHKAKGLEAEHIILLNCASDIYGFPSNIVDDPIMNYLLSEADTFEFAEERRLFYVAITRAKKKMYVLYDQAAPSIFVSDFEEIPVAERCPICGIGRRIVAKKGVASNGNPYTTYTCSNNEGCEYVETVFENVNAHYQNRRPAGPRTSRRTKQKSH